MYKQFLDSTTKTYRRVVKKYDAKNVSCDVDDVAAIAVYLFYQEGGRNNFDDSFSELENVEIQEDDDKFDEDENSDESDDFSDEVIKDTIDQIVKKIMNKILKSADKHEPVDVTMDVIKQMTSY